METQNYSNHTRFYPPFHFVLIPTLLLTLIGSIVNLVQSWGDHQRLYSSALIVVLTACVIVMSFSARIFALKAQDRAIRAEESLRHFAMTGKLLHPGLTMGQIIALRFASDAEFAALAQRAAKDSLSPTDIKKAVQNWRADTYRA
jgi:hypothetical protein